MYKIISGFLLLFVIAACNKDYIEPNEFSDVAWYTNKQNFGDYKVKVGQHMSFMDLSQNALSHKWEIETGNSYLMTGFSDNDSLELFIDQDKGLTTDDLTVHVLFKNAGTNKVRLYNTFSEEVTYRGETPYTATKQGDLWVIDTSFIVEVYGALLPAYEVYKIIDDTLGNILGEELILSVTEEDLFSVQDSADWETVILEAGSRIKLLDLTTEDRPNNRIWTVYNQATPLQSRDSATIVYFNRLGKTPMMASLLSQRIQAVGDNTPAESAEKIVPLKVEVIKSTKPFIAVGGFAEIEGEEAITFTVAGEVDSISANAKDAFTVHVTNAITGFDATIPVSAVAINEEDGSKVELTLSDTIYGNDVVTVAYDNTSSMITSVDDRILKSFDARTIEMVMKGENIIADASGTVLDWAGYEEATASGAPQYGYMTAEEGTGAWWSSNNAFFKTEEKAASGVASLKFTGVDGDATRANDLWHMKVTDAFEFPKGSYIIRQQIFIKEGSDVKVLTNDLADGSNGFLEVMVINWDISEASVERGKWVTLEHSLVLDEPLLTSNLGRWGYYVKPDLNSGISTEQTFYLDNLEIIPIESRP